MSEGKKRIGSKMGVQHLPAISEIPSPLVESAQLAQRASIEFGETVEKILIKYGKRITDEQFVVNKVAQSTIDIYAMFVVLSRASRSVNNKKVTSEHEVNIANLFCSEVS